MTLEPPVAESTAVQLTRMEGVLTLINHKVDAVVPRVEHLEADVSLLKLSTQRLADDAEAAQATVVVTAQALRDQKEADDRTRGKLLTPTNILFSIITGLATFAALIQYVQK